MNFEMELKHKCTTLDELNQCQVRLKYQFPVSYQNFLLSQNGGFPFNCLFEYDKTKGSCIYFFGINLETEDHDLEWNFEVYRQRIPTEFIPIGSDPGGNLICIGGENRESIYFWFHEAETDPPTMNNMYLISNTLKEFLDSLEPDEGEDW